MKLCNADLRGGGRHSWLATNWIAAIFQQACLPSIIIMARSLSLCLDWSDASISLSNSFPEWRDKCTTEVFNPCVLLTSYTWMYCSLVILTLSRWDKIFCEVTEDSYVFGGTCSQPRSCIFWRLFHAWTNPLQFKKHWNVQNRGFSRTRVAPTCCCVWSGISANR